MTAFLSGPLVIAGIAVLAGGLYLLQRLRVRHRPVQVVSTLFWREAVEEARARVFVQRFRHPLAYLFLLGILSLLWLAVAGVDLDRRTGEHHLVLIDASARAAEAGRFAATMRHVEEAVGDLPRARRRVVLCGAAPRTLLAPGEPDRLLSARAGGLAPDAAPSSLERALVDHLPALAGAEGATIWIAGDAPLSQVVEAMVPDGVRLERLVPERPETASANRGIVALGVSPAERGAWDRVDVLVTIAGEDAAGATVTATLDGSALPEGAVRTETTGGVALRFSDLPAAGGRFAVALDGTDANPLDDRAARVLPVRRPLRVVLSPSIAPWLEPALAADPAVTLVSSGAEVAVRRAGETVGTGLPALEFVARDEQEESILLSHEPDTDSAALLSEALVALGLDQVDAMEMAEVAGGPITLGARPANVRAIGVWEELLADDYNFVSSRSFPLFVALSVRWLLDVREIPAEIAAGRPLPGVAALMTDDRRVDAVGGTLRPPRAGEYEDERGTKIAVALLDRASTAGATAALPEDAEGPAGSETPLTSVLAVLALAMLGAEWFLHRRGELP